MAKENRCKTEPKKMKKEKYDPTDDVNFFFNSLKDHIGHKIVIVGYGKPEIVNVAIECETCGLVIDDLEKE